MVHSSSNASTRRVASNRFSAVFPSTSQTRINVLTNGGGESTLARSQSIGREPRLRTPLTISNRSLHNGGVSLTADTLRALATTTPINEFVAGGELSFI
jgi:hypothetical protein